MAVTVFVASVAGSLLSSGVKAAGTGGKIVDGKPAGRRDQPYSVYISSDGKTVDCGASLVGPVWALTLAKCVNSEYLLNYTVVAAERKLNIDDGEVSYTVKDVIPFDSSSNSIALLLLGEVVEVERKDIAIVPLSSMTPDKKARCVLTAYGHQKATKPGKKKQKLDVKVTDAGDCDMASEFDPSVDLCFVPRKQRDAERMPCHGDEGSPIACELDGATVQVAVNTENSCNSTAFPARDLQTYVAWIDRYLKASGCGDSPTVINGKYNAIDGSSVAVLKCADGYVMPESHPKYIVCSPDGVWSASAKCIRKAEWNALKVRWNPDPTLGFFDMPRELTSAIELGWELMTPSTCDDNPRFRGLRYWKDGDLSVILIFGGNGYIAGIQFGFRKDYQPNPNNFPFERMINTQFILEDGVYYNTAYFVPPAEVCEGRSEKDMTRFGTGKGLWIQNGRRPLRDFIEIPRKQEQIARTDWVKDNCIPTMGTHYWFNVTKKMDCNYLYQAFLLYHEGRLTGFGWALNIFLERNTTLVEYVPPEYFPANTPECVYSLGTATQQHIYLTDDPLTYTCPGKKPKYSTGHY